jgi:integrase
MSATIIPIPSAQLADRSSLTEAAKTYVQAAKAASTRRAYQTDWRDFQAWCEGSGLESLPAAPETVAFYLTALARRLKVSTLQRRISAISQAHQAAQRESPTKSIAVRTVMAGIRRTHGTAQVGKAAAVTEDIKAMLDTLPKNLLGVRDRALLLVGFAGAFRRSELVGLNVEDVQFSRHGLLITIRQSKTDQYAQGQIIGIPRGQHKTTCPVRSLEAWLKAAGIAEGPIFRSVNRHGQVQPTRLSDKAVALVVKRAAAACGLDPARYAGHSLRAGLATAAAAGVAERQIMKQTRHTSERMVRKYIRDGELFRDNAAGSVGL